jgi:AAA family ATP:ADP antiporter
MALPENIAPARRPLRRAIALFFNFMMIVLAYYQVKAASRSLLIEFGGVEVFPYIWIGSAFVLLAFIGVYNRLVATRDRVQVVTGSLVVCAVVLSLFWLARGQATLWMLYAFYIFVDIFSVILVEQFWSLSNSVMRLGDGERSYWFVGTGGILGGVAGGVLASVLLRYTPMQTADLLMSCAGMLLVCAAATILISRNGLLREIPAEERVALDGRGLAALLRNRYLVLVAVIVCFSQLVEPVIEYQFLTEVSDRYPERDARTQVISEFFSLLSLVSMLVNLFVTPFVHRHLGAVAGLAVQPLVVSVASAAYMLHTTLASAAVMKISDRGLSYSINRASKELLYIPMDAVNNYQVKAWIDMLGYRMFKVLGSGLILLAGLWLPAGAGTAPLGWLTLGICGAWLFAIALLATEYRGMVAAMRT